MYIVLTILYMNLTPLVRAILVTVIQHRGLH